MTFIKRCLSILIIIFFTNASYGEFNPWNSNVRTGDELYHIHDKSGKKSYILNGVQGGAFLLVKFFQVVISPQDGPNCRHIPTCSVYGEQAVVKHGAFFGSIMAGERLLRCNPFYPPERDPVPEKVFGK